MQPGNDHHLIIREEDDERTFPLPEGETHLGRAGSNEVQLREKSVSRKHCRLERDGDRVLIFDDRTRNATRIRRHGKERIKKANGRILRDQDVLFVGRMEIVYRGCSGPGAATTSQQSDVSPVVGAVPLERPQAPTPVTNPTAQQPPAQQPQQPWPGQQAQQPPAQPYPGQQAQQPPAQPYPGQQAQQPPAQPYPGQQAQQPPAQQPDQFIPQGQQPPQGYGPPGQQPVTFNPAPATEPKKPKKIKRRKRKLAPKAKISSSSSAPVKSRSNPGVSLAIGTGVLIVLLIVISQAFKRRDNDDIRLAQQRSAAEKKMSERETQLQARLDNTNSQIAKLQQMLAALEKASPGQPPVAVNENEGPAPVEPSGELASSSPSDERILPDGGSGGKGLAETKALMASLIKERNELQGNLKEYGGLTGGTDTTKIDAAYARRTEVFDSNRILSVEDDEDTRKTAVARIPQKVELSKKDYSDLVDRLKETVGNYGLPVANPADLEPDLTELVRATGTDGARGLVTVYLYSSELRAKMEKTMTFLKRRVDVLMKNAYKINDDKGKYKSGGGYYGSRHNHYLEQLQRLLELSAKKIEIKKNQKRRLEAFQEALGTGFERLTSVDSTKHLTAVYSKSKDTDMKRNMVGAFSKGNALQAVPALIKSLSTPDQELKGLVKTALASITGVNLGDNKKIWDAWWKENGKSATN